MKQAEYIFNYDELEKSLNSFRERGITELFVHDRKISGDKQALMQFLDKCRNCIPEVYVSLPVNAELVDGEVIAKAGEVFCSLEIPLVPKPKPVYLFDKKLYSKKANLLNQNGNLFGFAMDFALTEADSFKAFRDRLDFAAGLFPNHIDFPQLYNAELREKATGTFSSQDIGWAKKIAYSVETFYSFGRAVPWFNYVLGPLKIAPSKFFADFAEWLKLNNFNFDRSNLPEGLDHKEIEKMQLSFLEMKYEEKKLTHLYPVVYDLVRLNGGYARLEGEGEECILDLSFNPEDLMSPAICSLASFTDNVCMEECKIKIYTGEEFPEYRIL